MSCRPLDLRRDPCVDGYASSDGTFSSKKPFSASLSVLPFGLVDLFVQLSILRDQYLLPSTHTTLGLGLRTWMQLDLTIDAAALA